jgi:serine/threonine protein kinase
MSDFGTARHLDQNEPAILPHYAFPPGDTRYASPEMLALLHDDDPSIALAGDIYGLGATLFELWSGAILGVQLFTSRFMADLAQAMNAVNKRDRFRIFTEFVPNLVAGHPLPSCPSPLFNSWANEHVFSPVAQFEFSNRLVRSFSLDGRTGPRPCAGELLPQIASEGFGFHAARSYR